MPLITQRREGRAAAFVRQLRAILSIALLAATTYSAFAQTPAKDPAKSESKAEEKRRKQRSRRS